MFLCISNIIVLNVGNLVTVIVQQKLDIPYFKSCHGKHFAAMRLHAGFRYASRFMHGRENAEICSSLLSCPHTDIHPM
jgi:hypothetical protein